MRSEPGPGWRSYKVSTPPYHPGYLKGRITLPYPTLEKEGLHAQLFARVAKTFVEVQIGTSRLRRVSGMAEGPFGTSYRDGAADSRIGAFGRLTQSFQRHAFLSHEREDHDEALLGDNGLRVWANPIRQAVATTTPKKRREVTIRELRLKSKRARNRRGRSLCSASRLAPLAGVFPSASG